MLTEVDRHGCLSFSGALMLADEEGHGRDSGRAVFQRFTDGVAQPDEGERSGTSVVAIG